MQIVSYIGYGLLVLIALSMTYGVRNELGIVDSVIFVTLLQVSAAIIIPLAHIDLMHAWWAIAAAYTPLWICPRLRWKWPTLYRISLFPSMLFGRLIRIGIPEEKIKAAKSASWDKFLHENETTKRE